MTACGGLLALAVAGGGCGAIGSAKTPSTPANGGTVSYALPPSSAPNYIFPFSSPQYFTVVNSSNLQLLLYRPLYWFGTPGGKPYLDPGRSLAVPPAYNGQVVTITLKPGYRWSNGERVTARDVLFWMHMMQAEKANWGGYVPGAFPDNVTSIRAAGPDVIAMTIKGRYSPSWFTYNELSQITPMPMAWDRTASGNSDCTDHVSDCAAVYNYLNAQSLDAVTYPSSHLWQVVDGPWRLTGLTSEGVLTFHLNKKYSGPLPPHHIAVFEERPFTSEQAEFNVLQAGGSQGLAVGYLPTVDAPVPASGTQAGQNPVPGYQLHPLYAWGLNYFVYNFSNTTGQAAIFKQLYFRQAFQLLVNQAEIIQGPLHGYGQVSVGPVGDTPVTNYLSPQARKLDDPFSYNPVRAAALLRQNGWTVVTGGTSTCTSPGTGPRQCGAGIRRGEPLRFTLLYATGIDWVNSAVKQIQSNDAQVGIQVTLQGEPIASVLGAASKCTGQVTAKGPCPWQLADWGGGWSYVPDYLPTGEELFQTGSLGNTGNYSDSHNDALIQATLRSSSRKALYAWENYLALQLPVVMQPNAPSALVESMNSLKLNGALSPTLAITPEDWYYVR